MKPIMKLEWIILIAALMLFSFSIGYYIGKSQRGVPVSQITVITERTGEE